MENWKIPLYAPSHYSPPTHLKPPTFPWVQTWAVSIPRGQSSRPHDQMELASGDVGLTQWHVWTNEDPFCSVGVNPGYVFLQSGIFAVCGQGSTIRGWVTRECVTECDFIRKVWGRLFRYRSHRLAYSEHLHSINDAILHN